MSYSFTARAQVFPRGDTNQNGSVDISDVTCLINYLLNGTWPDDHEWVDLGLPSGTLWATCNVGADRPGDFGDYFAWGETAPKDSYSWENYMWCYGYSSTLTKYCTNSSFGYNGFVDNKAELDPVDDAAYVNWDPSWRMPTYDQLEELRTQCTWTWRIKDGSYGHLITGPNGNSIFLPAAGYRESEYINYTDTWGDYWTRELAPGYSNLARYLYLGEQLIGWDGSNRINGYTVRPVRLTQN